MSAREQAIVNLNLASRSLVDVMAILVELRTLVQERERVVRALGAIEEAEAYLQRARLALPARGTDTGNKIDCADRCEQEGGT